MINPTEKDIGRKVMWTPGDPGSYCCSGGKREVFVGVIAAPLEFAVWDGAKDALIRCDFGPANILTGTTWADVVSCQWADDL